jgi:hypothetical protein
MHGALVKAEELGHPLFDDTAGSKRAGFVCADIRLLGAQEEGDVGLGHA